MGNIFTGIGSIIPSVTKTNSDFQDNEFYDEKGIAFTDSGEIITGKFKKITGIEERRYMTSEQNTSDLGLIAAERALKDSGLDREKIDHIIVAHNFGDVSEGSIQSDIMPSLAARIKQRLGIHNPAAVCYDLLFGCPGWVQGVIQADSFIKTGMASNVLVIGCEALSRVLDKHDRDSMIFSDGAGACVLSKSDSNNGILSYSAVTHAVKEADYLFCGKSNKPNSNDIKYIKMQGRKIYEYALLNVPLAMKDAMDKSGRNIKELKKVFIHQANEKMDEAIIHRFYKLFNETDMPEDIMPMSIHKLGNSSVATVPTLLDMVYQNQMEGHKIEKGDLILLASVGAGMNINAIVYEV